VQKSQEFLSRLATGSVGLIPEGGNKQNWGICYEPNPTVLNRTAPSGKASSSQIVKRKRKL
jgi:hypothetical protein